MIIDELAHAENILEKNALNEEHKGYDLAILAKYYIYLGKDYKTTRKLIENFCIKNVKYFNSITNYYLIDYAITIAKKYRLRIPIDITISLPEITHIQSVNNRGYEKILFLALFIAKQQKYNNVKIKNRKSPSMMGFYCDVSFKSLVRFSGAKWTVAERNKASNYLYNQNLIDITSFDWVEIKYSSEGYPAILASDIEDGWLKYLKYSGETKIENCNQCGKLYYKKSNRQEFCPKCSKENERENTRKRVEKYRNNVTV